jgi:hypothetical protein
MDAGISRAQLACGIRRGRWQRIGRGILQADGREPRAGDHILRAVLSAGPGAVVGFESAAALHGWDLLHQPREPQLISPLSGRGCYRTALAASEVTLHGLVPVTTPIRTLVDIACESSREDAVVAIDSALRAGAVSLRELRRQFARSHRRAIPIGRQALALADPGSGSVPETQARLLFARAGLPPPVCQLSVVIDGQFVARADFGWEWARLVAEIDGYAHHSDRAAFQRDRTRQNALVQAGWLVLRFTVEDIRSRPDDVVAEVRRALRRPL